MSNRTFLHRGVVHSVPDPSRLRSLPTAVLAVGLLLAAGCSPPPEPQVRPRPVRVAQVQTAALGSNAGFAGEVRARREIQLAFRIGGKLAVRRVEVGDRVRKGQLIAQLESDDDRLAVQSLKAQLIAAQAERDFLRADLERFRELLQQAVIAQPEWERHETAYTAARERVAALEAQRAQAGNRLAYAELRAERDGVISGLAAEAGDVIAPGQPVAVLAQFDQKDIVIQVPEQRVQGLKPGLEVIARLGADGPRPLKARIREIAPAADLLTRTYTVRAALVEGLDQAALGMTATLWLPAPKPSAALAIPLSALFTTPADPSGARVWIVDRSSATVATRRVTPGAPLPDARIEVSGLSPGEWVVTAGVQRLAEGQAVNVLEPVAAIAANDLTHREGAGP